MYCTGVKALLARRYCVGRSRLYARVGSGFAQARAANTMPEPKTYKQAMVSPEWEQWKATIQAELDALDKHNVWKLVDQKIVKDGRKVRGCSNGRRTLTAKLLGTKLILLFAVSNNKKESTTTKLIHQLLDTPCSVRYSHSLF